ncbi:MAG: ligase-associated DNA damage response DEXH box helicase [Thermoflavifilum sp.]|uniref:ligase-associated DNA damage response DEXH box helicase n=1 Tax=Thermoflavifilum sp. TaxID=1968839 RepID=UPI0018A60608|nr:ligase-associated DNA damage response DEXH box helicase [Thermoflavifilum sp.]QOR76915.1 MAG: ligase-associated DNA damage response DEXH box helicase [Thermoflavifilum sp.]
MDIEQKLSETPGYQAISRWMQQKGWTIADFQRQTWIKVLQGYSGLLQAPTGCGKTFAVFLPMLARWMNTQAHHLAQRTADTATRKGLQLLWITPLRALANDLARSMQQAIQEMDIPWQVGIRNGDTLPSERRQQSKQMPEVLVITPESLHLLLTHAHHEAYFQHLSMIVIDEWHELLGSKRGLLVSLALAYLQHLRHSHFHCAPIPVWALSATLAEPTEALDALLGSTIPTSQRTIIRAHIQKKIQIDTIYPDEITHYSWAGHLGLKLIHKVIPIIQQSRSSLLFINTRGMAERWYQALLDEAPELAGTLAIHHGSMDMALRQWVEQALHQGQLKAVICTSSLDLGVDFRPVDTVIQVGSPKSIARFLQRAGRSGHQPDACSHIYFLPTHALELAEVAALKSAIEQQQVEQPRPVVMAFDVLIQFLSTLAVGGGFQAETLFSVIRSTYAYQHLSLDEWSWILQFLTQGGEALQHYDEFQKLELREGYYRITHRRLAMLHRLHIGTIVSDAMLKVKCLHGGYVGMIEEYFIDRLKPGDCFVLAGKTLELVRIKDMVVWVKKSPAQEAWIPSWMGGRIPLSGPLAAELRKQLADRRQQVPEIAYLQPLLELQQQLSHIPDEDELLVEYIRTRDGNHLFVYPFEGRQVHEAMASLLAYRIASDQPCTFSIAMNDYGFELLTDQPLAIQPTTLKRWLHPASLQEDLLQSINATEMARRKFRDIACIAGMVFQGYPGAYKTQRHLQSSTSLLFDVLRQYDPGNLLLRQALDEALLEQVDLLRLQETLHRIQHQEIILQTPHQFTPFSFPLKVDSLRENLSTEKWEDRIRRMLRQLQRAT